ncbi:hypothetical protein [Marivirga sp.]|uniref:hypothetical protein n=1 Tax=Marivirga sp. TaxID=2018662 RepID=UPI002D80419D|nr:hypothetical protein [Marivirga sp.]HET8859619.1 hypothetical protein [Marivirga sp.]
MNYKISTFVLFLALVAFAIYHFSTIKNENANTPANEDLVEVKADENGSSHLDKELSSYFADQLANGVDSTLGNFINFDTAKAKLDSIRDYRGKNPGNSQIHNSYGYIFGLQKMRELISRIDKINMAQDTVDLTGVRVYRTISKVRGKKYFDVFMIAVTKENKDFPDLKNPDLKKDFEGEEPILNFSAPCPDQCK